MDLTTFIIGAGILWLILFGCTKCTSEIIENKYDKKNYPDKIEIKVLQQKIYKYTYNPYLCGFTIDTINIDKDDCDYDENWSSIFYKK